MWCTSCVENLKSCRRLEWMPTGNGCGGEGATQRKDTSTTIEYLFPHSDVRHSAAPTPTQASRLPHSLPHNIPSLRHDQMVAFGIIAIPQPKPLSPRKNQEAHHQRNDVVCMSRYSLVTFVSTGRIPSKTGQGTKAAPRTRRVSIPLPPPYPSSK